MWDEGHRVYAVVLLCQGRQSLRAFEHFEEQFAATANVDGSALFEAKRNARFALQRALRRHDGALTHRLLAEAERNLASGDSRLDRERDGSAWVRHKLAEGYATTADETIARTVP